MNITEVLAEIERLEKAGILAQADIAVFGRTDAEHVYSVRIVGYTTHDGGMNVR